MYLCAIWMRNVIPRASIERAARLLLRVLRRANFDGSRSRFVRSFVSCSPSRPTASNSVTPGLDGSSNAANAALVNEPVIYLVYRPTSVCTFPTSLLPVPRFQYSTVITT